MRTKIQTIGLTGIATLVMAGLGTSASAQGYNPTWSVTGAGASVVAADCTDCEEDLGIIIACRGANQPAKVTVNAAATEFGQDGASAPVTFTIDGRNYTNQARTVFFGKIGNTPEFDLYKGDPLIEAMKSGSRMTVRFQGQTTNIGLQGSRAALDRFAQQCGWSGGGFGQPVAQNNTPSFIPQTGRQPVSGQPAGSVPNFIPQPAGGSGFVPQPAAPQPAVPPSTGGPNPVLPGNDGEMWFVTNYNDPKTGQPALTLSFGIPETDAIGFVGRCTRGPRGIGIPVELLIDYGLNPNGTPVSVSLQTTTYRGSLNGQVFVENEEYAGIRAEIPMDDGLWQGISSSNIVAMKAAGAQTTAQFAYFDTAPISRFVSQCRSQLGLQTTGISGGQSQGGQSGGGTPFPSQPTGGTAAAAGSLAFLCNDGVQVRARIEQAGSTRIAHVSENNGPETPLIQVAADWGQKFSNGQMTLHATTDSAQYVSGTAQRFCRKN